MQLPGMFTDPVRVRLEVTWWPEDDSFSLSRSVWTRPDQRTVWQMEGLECSGSPIRLPALPDRWAIAEASTLAYVVGLHDENEAAGPFR